MTKLKVEVAFGLRAQILAQFMTPTMDRNTGLDQLEGKNFTGLRFVFDIRTPAAMTQAETCFL